LVSKTLSRIFVIDSEVFLETRNLEERNDDKMVSLSFYVFVSLCIRVCRDPVFFVLVPRREVGQGGEDGRAVGPATVCCDTDLRGVDSDRGGVA